MEKSVQVEKQKLRKEMLAKREAVSTDELLLHSKKICRQLIELSESISAKSVHAYLPLPGEIDIRPFLQHLIDQKISVATPQALANRRLKNLVLNSLSELEKGIFGTSHPANSFEYLASYDLIVVPGLAFDSRNYRLGFGAGYYDTFLKDHPNSLKVGLAFPFQMVEKVPRESHDIALDRILL